MTQSESGTLLVVGDQISAELARTLDLSGRTWHGAPEYDGVNLAAK